MKRRKAALVAFAFHHPGVRIALGLRQRARTRRLNALFLGATVVVTAVAWLASPDDIRSWLAATTFAAGHFTWSSVYAWLALRRFEATFADADG